MTSSNFGHIGDTVA